MVKPSAVHQQITSGTLEPVYLLLGDDEYEKDEFAAEFEETIDAELRAFNVDRFHGSDASLGDVLAAAQTLPMMAPRRLVIVSRADRLLNPKRESNATTKDLEALISFVENPPSHATLVLGVTDLDKRPVMQKLLKKAIVIKCGDLRKVGDAQHWIRAQLKVEGRRMASDAIQGLAARVGPNTMRLRSELDRLLLFVPVESEITVQDVNDVAGAPAGHDDWAMTNAITRNAPNVALRELALLLETGIRPEMVLGQLAWVARTKLPATQTQTAIEAVFRTDQALKGSGGNPRVLLERLVVELCDPKRG